MPIPTEHKTVQARILQYAQEIGWCFVPRAEVEPRRGFSPLTGPHPGPLPEGEGIKTRAQGASLYFADLLYAKVREFNPQYHEAEGALIGDFERFHADIRGNRNFLAALRNQHKFFGKEQRKAFFREYKEIEMLYEIVSPDALLSPFIRDYAALSAIYDVVRNAYAKRVYVDRAFLKKTNELVQKHIGSEMHDLAKGDYIAIDPDSIEAIKRRKEGKAAKVINLVKAIEKAAEENSDDPFLVAMAERAKAVLEGFEDRQTSTEEALNELLAKIGRNEQRKQEQAAKGLDGLTYFVLCKLAEEKIANAEAVSQKVRGAFAAYPNWRSSEKEQRELRTRMTFAIFAEEESEEKVAVLVEAVLSVLTKAGKQ